ncbi:MAG: GNAT family N-acetyltransferase [Anaerolineae bacterium]|nr:GNAT family N-acetyltransferase [Anaerolineae bacterium]MDW8300600.1 GNAT family N-acetyltransferase [Anaerolineae bacterium]
MATLECRSLDLHLKVTFRLAERDDLPKLEWYGKYTHFRRVFQRTYEEQLRGERLMLLADVNGFPIGQIFIQLDKQAEQLQAGGKHAYLYSLRVMDAFQRQGLGSALLREAEALLRERGYTSVSIAAAKENDAARRLYERHGFQVVDEDAGRWSYVDHEGVTHYVNEPCWIMEKWLG